MAEARIGYLDGWRGFAVLAVLYGHFMVGDWINMGRLGVELFFVLSGRLMAEILFVRNTPLSSFFPRRISRIYPALLFFALAILAATLARHKANPTIPQILTVITFTYNYLHQVVGISGSLNHIWSLCIEEHVYVILGLLALVKRRYDAVSVPLVCAALILIAVTIGTVQTLNGMTYYDVYWRTDVRGASILMGVVAYLWLNDAAQSDRTPGWVPLALLAGGFALSAKPIPDPIKYSVATACLACAVVLLPRAPALVHRIFESRIAMLFGVLSYSVYLWQQPFYNLSVGFPLRLVTTLPAAIVLGYLSYRFVEKPARAFLNARWHTRRSKVTEAAT